MYLLFPYTTLFRSQAANRDVCHRCIDQRVDRPETVRPRRPKDSRSERQRRQNTLRCGIPETLRKLPAQEGRFAFAHASLTPFLQALLERGSQKIRSGISK